ncbi:hypothetical protein HNP84_005356 [Thermocatellispora tengchongensis]|uniref:Uncharacterized protein n=1 Tax=Thermocatellispora tengchongensis TaxID=1073253 RepID=A0A840P8J4_9ACTN|nr:hypothetical protein [Thermocatellispora tengchongensis]
MRVFDGITDPEGAEPLAVRRVDLDHRVRVRGTTGRDGGGGPVCVIDVLRVAAP